MSHALVCPNCGRGDRLATREKAEIWQPAEFTVVDGEIEVEWDAYDSEDVGDTETVGYACKECCWVFDEISELVTEEDFARSQLA